MSAQASFLSIAHTKKLRCEKFLNEMEQIVPWDRLTQGSAPAVRPGNLLEDDTQLPGPG